MSEDHRGQVVPLRRPVRTRSTESAGARLLDLLAEMTTVEPFLVEVAALAVELVPECDTAAVTLIRDRGPALVAAFDDRARAVDETEHAAGLGPCLQAARTDQVVQTDDVAHVPPVIEEGDPAWSEVARAAGITATVSIPIPAGQGIAAALNLYRVDGTGWPPGSLDVAEEIATYAGSAVLVAFRLDG